MAKQNITAIIYDRKGRVLSVGKNSYTKTHTKQAMMAKECGLDEKIYLHAELDAIIKCKDLTRAHKIHVFRVNAAGQYCNAAPCPICQLAIKRAGIKIVSHT